MKRGFLVFNPSSGTDTKSDHQVSDVVREFERHGIDITPSITEPGGSVVRQVRDIMEDSPDLIVSWGGDGTINEVVNGMFPSKVPLGLLSGGTANLLVKEMGIPTRIHSAIRVISEGKTRSITVGQANQRFFVLMAGIGFDSEIVKNVDWNVKRKWGKIAFGFAALNTISKYKFPQLALRIDDQERQCVFAVICNAKEYAAHFVLTPQANISNDYFYACLFMEPGVSNLLKYVFHAAQGKLSKLPSVEILQCSKVEATGPGEIPVQADGELIGHLPMKFVIHPRSLNIFCP
jgi:diacylglycerol kinase (ATP)